MMIQPMRDHIVVLQDPIRDDITTAGIVVMASKGIVDSQSQMGRTGTVKAVGEAIHPDDLKVGDRVCYGEFMHKEYIEAGVKYIVLRDDDICGVIEE